MKIAILGAGAFGSALGEILSDNGHQISYYDPLILSNTLKEVLDAAQYIVLAIPSRAIVDVLPSLPTDVPIVVATKGLLGNKIFKRFHDVLVISGPGFASDIKITKLLTSLLPIKDWPSCLMLTIFILIILLI